MFFFPFAQNHIQYDFSSNTAVRAKRGNNIKEGLQGRLA
jgi:hypothetical protein